MTIAEKHLLYCLASGWLWVFSVSYPALWASPSPVSSVPNCALDSRILRHNRQWAQAVLATTVEKIEALAGENQELGYIDDFVDYNDPRTPVFSCIEFTYKALTHPGDERLFMDGGYAFGVWLWNLKDGSPALLNTPGRLPLWLGRNGVKQQHPISCLGLGVAIDCQGAVPVGVRKLLNDLDRQLRAPQEPERWQENQGVPVNSAIFIVKNPSKKSPDLTLAFALRNNTSHPWHYELRQPYVMWLVDENIPFQVQAINNGRHRLVREQLKLLPGQAVIFKPFTVSLQSHGNHKIRAILRSAGESRLAQAELYLSFP